MPKSTIAVSGIMLRNAGNELIVEAEINGVWTVVIREWVGRMEFAVSHIVEPSGMERHYEEGKALSDRYSKESHPAKEGKQ